MNRIAFVLLPVAVLVIVAVVFFRASRREAADARPGTATNRSGGDSASSAEMTRLRAEVESLRQEAEKQRQRAATAELKLAEATAAASAEPEAAEKKPAAKKGDWKSRRDSELEAKIKSMAWRKNVNGLVDYWKELEKARVEGRAPRMDPEMIARLTQITKDATDLHKFLGIEGANVYDAFNNELVHEAWMDAFLQELTGGTVTEGQLARLRGSKLYENNEPDFENASLLESWKYLIEHNQLYGSATAGVFTPEQMAQVSKAVTPTFMLSVYASYSERTLGGASAVTDYWIDSFKLDTAAQRAAVELVAGDFTTQLKALHQSYATQYGSTLPRDAEFELRIKALDLQIAAEKRLIDSLQLDPEQAKKFLKGSGSAIRLGN